jgi:hypothetical protein
MLTMKENRKNRSMKQEFMLYKRMKEAEEAFEDAEDMMEDENEGEGKMNCKKRNCEMGKRKACK